MQYHYNTLNYNYMNCIRRLFFSAFFLMLYGMFFSLISFFAASAYCVSKLQFQQKKLLQHGEICHFEKNYYLCNY